MRQEKGMQTTIIAVMAIAILVMSVGFAAFSQNLNINGNATFSQAKWSVHFDTASYTETSNSTVHANPAPTPTATDLSYTVTLAKPGDKYEFTVDVINEGTMDAALNSITITSTPSTLPVYVGHVVNYAGTDYTATDSSISGVTLTKQTGNTPGRQTVKVTVTYKEPSNANDLPQNADQTVTFNVGLGYSSL